MVIIRVYIKFMNLAREICPRIFNGTLLFPTNRMRLDADDHRWNLNFTEKEMYFHVDFLKKENLGPNSAPTEILKIAAQK